MCIRKFKITGYRMLSEPLFYFRLKLCKITITSHLLSHFAHHNEVAMGIEYSCKKKKNC